MKTKMITKKMLVVAFLLALTTNVINAQDRIYLGIRVPQMSTDERTNIGVESNQLTARGQLIFNNDSLTLQYWNGDKWAEVTDKQAILEHLVNNFSIELGDTILNYLIHNFSTELGDTIVNYITNNFSTELGDTILNYIIHNFSTELGDTILNYIIHNFSIELGDTIMTHIANNFSTALGDTILNYISNNVTNGLLDSIMSNVNVSGQNGIEILGNGTKHITVQLPEGQHNDQILIWDHSAKIWEPGNQAPGVRQVTILVDNGTFHTENLIFYGITTVANSALEVVSIEPIFSNRAMRRNFLKVEASVQVVGNAADWIISIENRNFNPSNSFILESVIISYICSDTDDLMNYSQGLTEIFGY
ncbi:MAG: hypothetical protein FWG79_04510 [Bacteroidales bacterium]|nr:hypothetical protein [Bacteroidales bacterium]